VPTVQIATSSFLVDTRRIIINKIRISHLLQLPTELHVEIFVWLVIGCLNELVENRSLVDHFEDLDHRFDELLDLKPEDREYDEEQERFVITILEQVFVTLIDVYLEPYLAACSMARCWRSRRRAIFRRAATEYLEVLEPSVKASRRKMMRAWFGSAVWGVINEDYHQWDIKDNVRPEDAWMEFFESSMDFWYLGYKASILRGILSTEELLSQPSRYICQWRANIVTPHSSIRAVRQ
jgi:hypothetical protein